MKKNQPAITHTEIICYAIRHLETEANNMKKRCEGKPELNESLEYFLAQQAPKLEALKELYRIETGVEYI